MEGSGVSSVVTRGDVRGIGKGSLFPLHIGRPTGSKNKVMSKKTPGRSASVPAPAGRGVSDDPDDFSPGAVMAGRSAANFSACEEQIEKNVDVSGRSAVDFVACDGQIQKHISAAGINAADFSLGKGQI